MKTSPHVENFVDQVSGQLHVFFTPQIKTIFVLELLLMDNNVAFGLRMSRKIRQK
jgi:hypothetical protein